MLRLVPCILLAAPAAASPIAEVVCAPTSEMVGRLEQTQGVVRTAVGVRDPEQVMEVWTSPGGERWTLVVAYAAGTSCIVAMGDNWTDLTPEVGGGM